MCMLRIRLYPAVIVSLPVFWLLGYPHLYCHGPYVEVRKLSKSTLGEIDVLGSFGASGTCVNNSDKNAFLLSGFAYYEG